MAAEDLDRAAEIARADYPFSPAASTKRAYTSLQSMQIFLRDGFIDRYTGEQLVFPPVLRLLGNLLPDEFPAHSNWKMSETHMAYWELFPTVDHLVPVARGGLDTPENWVCASMRTNQAKLGWTVDELGWTVHPPGDIHEWDGLTRWFVEYAANHANALDNAYQRKWHSAAIKALGGA